MAERKPVIAQDTIDEIKEGKIRIPTKAEYDAADEIGEARMRPPKPVVSNGEAEKKSS
jgi:hypothetical protein